MRLPRLRAELRLERKLPIDMVDRLAHHGRNVLFELVANLREAREVDVARNVRRRHVDDSRQRSESRGRGDFDPDAGLVLDRALDLRVDAGIGDSITTSLLNLARPIAITPRSNPMQIDITASMRGAGSTSRDQNANNVTAIPISATASSSRTARIVVLVRAVHATLAGPRSRARRHGTYSSPARRQSAAGQSQAPRTASLAHGAAGPTPWRTDAPQPRNSTEIDETSAQKCRSLPKPNGCRAVDFFSPP